LHIRILCLNLLFNTVARGYPTSHTSKIPMGGHRIHTSCPPMGGQRIACPLCGVDTRYTLCEKNMTRNACIQRELNCVGLFSEMPQVPIPDQVTLRCATVRPNGALVLCCDRAPADVAMTTVAKQPALVLYVCEQDHRQAATPEPGRSDGRIRRHCGNVIDGVLAMTSIKFIPATTQRLP
jgi:hypothetical protein